MAWYSIGTENGEKEQNEARIFHCPECEPSKTMVIETVFPLTIWGGSIVTYSCNACGYRDDILID